jgi:hypothetical protein
MIAVERISSVDHQLCMFCHSIVIDSAEVCDAYHAVGISECVARQINRSQKLVIAVRERVKEA